MTKYITLYEHSTWHEKFKVLREYIKTHDFVLDDVINLRKGEIDSFIDTHKDVKLLNIFYYPSIVASAVDSIYDITGYFKRLYKVMQKNVECINIDIYSETRGTYNPLPGLKIINEDTFNAVQDFFENFGIIDGIKWPEYVLFFGDHKHETWIFDAVCKRIDAYEYFNIPKPSYTEYVEMVKRLQSS